MSRVFVLTIRAQADPERRPAVVRVRAGLKRALRRLRLKCEAIDELPPEAAAERRRSPRQRLLPFQAALSDGTRALHREILRCMANGETPSAELRGRLLEAAQAECMQRGQI